MRKIRKIWHRWYVQLIIILIPLVLGLVGYGIQYSKKGIMPDMVLYSTIRLFGFMFDGDKDGKGTAAVLLALARWLAIIPTGTALNRLLRPYTARFFSQIGFRFWNLRKNRLLIFGSNEECRHTADTAEGWVPLIRCSGDEVFNQLRRDGYRCVRTEPVSIMKAAVASTFSSADRQCRIVIHGEDEEINLGLCRTAVLEIRKAVGGDIERLEQLKAENGEHQEEIRETEEKIVSRLDRIRIVAFGDKNLESTYMDMVGQSFGVLKYINKYRMEAIGLVEKYPLVRFMDREKDIDGSGLISGKVDLYIIMVGFGDSNQELFTASMIVNQLLTAGENGIPVMKPVKYDLYDKEAVETNKNLNHMAFRFEHEFLGAVKAGMIHKADYLPMPLDPAEDKFDKTDINDQKFYKQIWERTAKNPDSVNVISVAVGSDLDNIDLARKLKAKMKEWNVRNVHIFVKVRKAENRTIHSDLFSDEMIPFGSDLEPFEMQHIFHDELEEMARKKHYLNALIRSSGENGTEESEKDIGNHAQYEWYTYDPMKKKSSIHAILGIRAKLLLMGLDYRKQGWKNPDGSVPEILEGNKDYFDIYAKNDLPEVDCVLDSDALGGTEVYRYPPVPDLESYRNPTLRKSLAIQEHYRWNAFMIGNGFVPATKEQIRNGELQNYSLRFHGCLTTFEGLFEYRRLLEEDGQDTATINKTINYDFHLMDDLWWYLNMFGYEIIRA